MLYIKKGETKKTWYICEKKELDNKSKFEVRIWKLNLNSSSLSNKFEIVKKFFNEINKLVPGFSDWFLDIFCRYVFSGYNSRILLDEKQKFHDFCREYIEAKNIDFTKFVNEKKKSVTSILVLPNELKELAITSASLKLFGIFSNDNILKLNENAYREMFKFLRLNSRECGIENKMFELIKCRTYKSYMSDTYMWKWIEIKTNQTPDSFIMDIFAYLLNSLISVLDCEVNPIPFIIKVTDLSVRWLMKPPCKNQTIYGEIYGGMDDIYGITIGQEAYNVYACNDTVYKASKIGLDLADEKLGEKEFDEFMNRLDRIDVTFPYLKILSLPIISKVLEVPYRQLLSVPPKHIILLGVFIRELSKDLLKEKFPFLFDLLVSVPRDCEDFINQFINTSLSDNLLSEELDEKLNKRRNKSAVYVTATKSSYKMREIQLFLNNKETIFGFESNVIKYKIFSSICGVISASKKNLISIITGKPISKITNSQLEYEVTNFFLKFYGGKLDDVFQQMTELADKDFF